MSTRFPRDAYAEYIDWQNAVYAAWKENPDDPDPAVRWIGDLIGKAEHAIAHPATCIDVTDMSDEEFLALLQRTSDENLSRERAAEEADGSAVEVTAEEARAIIGAEIAGKTDDEIVAWMAANDIADATPEDVRAYVRGEWGD